MKDLALRELIVDMAYEIIELEKDAREMEYYKAEAKEWRDKCNEMVTQQIKDSEVLMGNMLNLALTCDITPSKEIANGQS